MNRSLLMSVGFVLAAASLVVGGCAPPGDDLIAAGKVVVEKQSLGHTRVASVGVYQAGQNLVVDGSLRRSGSHRQRCLGHIDVAVIGPDGALLKQQTLRDAWPHMHGTAHFRMQFLLVPPVGSTVRVLFHDCGTAPASGHTAEEWETLWKAATET